MTKLSISRAWDETRAVLMRDGKLISTVALALLVLPGLIMSVFVPRGANASIAAQAVWMVVALVVLLMTFVGQLSILRLAMGPHIAVGEAIRHSGRRLVPFLLAFFAWMLPLLLLGAVPYRLIRNNPTSPQTAAGAGLLVLMTIGMIIAVRLVLIGSVAAAEAGGPVSILRRSWTLTAGNWWRLFGFLVAFAIAAIVLLYAVSAVLGIVIRLLLGSVSQLSVGALVGLIIVQLVTAGIYVVLFVMQARIYVQLAGDRDRVADTFR